MKPRDIAEALAAELRGVATVITVEVAGPGFINLELADDFWRERLREVLRAGTAYGDSDVGPGGRVNVEYVSANPTGPMHVGHGRGAVFGDALADLLAKAGLRCLPRILHQRCRRPGRCAGALGVSCVIARRSARLSARFPDGLYPGDYLVPVGAGDGGA